MDSSRAPPERASPSSCRRSSPPSRSPTARTSLSFLLVDYKGGAAFAECAGLPHTAGIVTDLDPHLTARALRSMEAELRRRERLLQAARCADVSAYEAAGRPDGPLGRLLIVVDEFAALAAELPDFVSGLVDIATARAFTRGPPAARDPAARRGGDRGDSRQHRAADRPARHRSRGVPRRRGLRRRRCHPRGRPGPRPPADRRRAGRSLSTGAGRRPRTRTATSNPRIGGALVLARPGGRRRRNGRGVRGKPWRVGGAVAPSDLAALVAAARAQPSRSACLTAPRPWLPAYPTLGDEAGSPAWLAADPRVAGPGDGPGAGCDARVRPPRSARPAGVRDAGPGSCPGRALGLRRRLRGPAGAPLCDHSRPRPHADRPATSISTASTSAAVGSDPLVALPPCGAVAGREDLDRAVRLIDRLRLRR